MTLSSHVAAVGSKLKTVDAILIKSWMKFIRPAKKDVQKTVLPASQPVPHFERVQERLRTDQQKWGTIQRILFSQRCPSTPREHFRDHSDTDTCPPSVP